MHYSSALYNLVYDSLVTIDYTITLYYNKLAVFIDSKQALNKVKTTLTVIEFYALPLKKVAFLKRRNNTNFRLMHF